MSKNSEFHEKAWGREEWLTNNEKYCGKILYLNKGYRCSIHYHKNKDESFYLMVGKIILEINGKQRVMEENDVQRITPGTRHRFSGLEQSVIIETSTPHEEKDCYRETQSEKIPEEEFNELLKIYSQNGSKNNLSKVQVNKD